MFDTSWSTKLISLFVALIVVLPSCTTHPDRPNFKSSNPLSSRNQITPATLTPIASFLNIGTPINLTDLPSTIVPLTSIPATLNQSNLVHPIPLQQGTSSRSAISIIKPISEEPRQTRGGTLRVATHTWFEGLDPHREPSTSFVAWGPGIAYSRLMRFRSGPDVELPSMEVECELCLDWNIEDSTTLTFTLRDNVKWQNQLGIGHNYVNAQDIASSFVKQMTEGWPNSHILHMLDKIEAPSDTELRITLMAPDADVFVALADGRSKITPEIATSSSNQQMPTSITGSSPWLQETLKPQTMVRMVRSEQSEIEPFLDAIEFHLIEEPETRLSAFLVGLIDIYRIEYFKDQIDSPDPKLYYFEPGSGIEIAFSTESPPFDEPKVRAAAMYALDPKEIIDKVWEGMAFFSLGFPSANKEWTVHENVWSNYFSSNDKSLAILKDTSIQSPVPITITSSDYGIQHMKSVQMFADQLSRGGFEPSINLLSRREYVAEAWKAGGYQMLIGPSFPQSSPNGYLLPVLHSRGAWNTTKHSDDKLDRLIFAQASEYDSESRAALIQDINISLLENGYRFMPITKIQPWTWKNNLQDFHPNFAGNEYSFWEKVWISR